MVSKEKTIFVYDDFSMQNPTWMGTLYVNSLKGGARPKATVMDPKTALDCKIPFQE